MRNGRGFPLTDFQRNDRMCPIGLATATAGPIESGNHGHCDRYMPGVRGVAAPCTGFIFSTNDSCGETHQTAARPGALARTPVASSGVLLGRAAGERTSSQEDLPRSYTRPPGHSSPGGIYRPPLNGVPSPATL